MSQISTCCKTVQIHGAKRGKRAAALAHTYISPCCMKRSTPVGDTTQHRTCTMFLHCTQSETRACVVSKSILLAGVWTILTLAASCWGFLSGFPFDLFPPVGALATGSVAFFPECIVIWLQLWKYIPDILLCAFLSDISLRSERVNSASCNNCHRTNIWVYTN